MSQHSHPNIDALARALARWMVARQHEDRRSARTAAADLQPSSSSSVIEMTRDQGARGELSYSATE